MCCEAVRVAERFAGAGGRIVLRRVGRDGGCKVSELLGLAVADALELAANARLDLELDVLGTAGVGLREMSVVVPRTSYSTWRSAPRGFSVVNRRRFG